MVVSYDPYFLTLNFEDDTKVITNDKHTDLSILIWIIIIIYKHNSNEKLWRRENSGCRCRLSMNLPL